jgi:ribosomal protein S18 acetylase RimI-like enzyme
MSTSFVIREPSAGDIPALARLHVTTWNATYPGVRSPPTVELRERQWREAFASTDRGWFCFAAARADGELVGFAQGNQYTEPEPPGYDGQLNKIYLLREYHRMGLGRRLMGHVARRFLGQGIRSMLLFADAANPACRFYEALGGEKLREPDGTPSEGNYGWKDLRTLAALCPPD